MKKLIQLLKEYSKLMEGSTQLQIMAILIAVVASLIALMLYRIVSCLIFGGWTSEDSEALFLVTALTAMTVWILRK